MTPPASDAPRSVSADPSSGGPVAYAQEAFAVLAAEVRKLARDPTDVFTRSVQPLLWLLVFGQVFSRMRGIPTGGADYVAFLTPGILAQSVLFTSIFYGIAIIWERDLGLLQKMLVTPARRSALVLGKAGAAGARAVVQALVVAAVARIADVPIRMSVLALPGVVAVVGLGGALFATMSLCVACLVKTRERFMGIGQVLTMPLFFASNAIYPVEMMPGWLQAVSRSNPLTYLVDALRSQMVPGAASPWGLSLDYAVLTAVFAALVALASRLYPTIAR